MFAGTIKKLMRKDGKDLNWTFIKGDDNNEYFVHQSDFLKDGWYECAALLTSNQEVRVTFVPGETEKGKRARQVVLL